MDFCSHKHLPLTPVNIQGLDIDFMDSFKYLGLHLYNKLDWTHNTNAIYKKGQSRLYLLLRFRSWGAAPKDFMTLQWHQPSFMVWFAGAAVSLLGTERN